MIELIAILVIFLVLAINEQMGRNGDEPPDDDQPLGIGGNP